MSLLSLKIEKLSVRQMVIEFANYFYMFCREQHYRTHPFIRLISEIIEPSQDNILKQYIEFCYECTEDPNSNPIFKCHDRFINLNIDNDDDDDTLKDIESRFKTTTEDIELAINYTNKFSSLFQ